MILRFQKQDGTVGELTLGGEPITLGRSPEADVPVIDERASRTHCGIRLWDGEYYVKDLKSKNGTFVNNDKVEMSRIRHGDKIRIGNFVIVVEDEDKPGTETLMGQVAGAMDEGKGFKTMLREIVEDVEESEKAEEDEPVKDDIPKEAAAKKTVIKKRAKTVIKKPKVDAGPKGEIEFDDPAPEASAVEDEAATEETPSVEETVSAEDSPVAEDSAVADASETESPPAEQSEKPTIEMDEDGDSDEVADKPKTIRLKSKPKRPVQIKINKRPS